MNNESIKNLFKWAANVIALIPGFAIMKTNLGVLPTFSKIIMGGLVEAVCSLIILLVWLNKESLKKYSPKFYTRQAIICMVLFLSLIFTYQYIYQSCNIPKGTHTRGTIRPLWISNDLKQYLIEKDIVSIENFFIDYGPRNTENAIKLKSSDSLLITEVIIYINFIMIFVFLTCSFAFIWVKFENRPLPVLE